MAPVGTTQPEMSRKNVARLDLGPEIAGFAKDFARF